MSLATNGTTSYADVTSSPVASGAVTIAAWVKPASTTGGTPVSLGRVANFDGYCLSLDASRRPYIEVMASAAATDIQANHTLACTTGSWSHIAGTSNGSNSHIPYKDGTAGTTNTTSSIPVGLDHTAIGTMWNWGGTLQFFNGSTAHVAIWNVVLTGAEIASLAAGANPTTVQAANLVFYAPCDEASSPTVDSVAARSLAWVASPTRDASNPTVDAPGSATVVAAVADATGDVATPTVTPATLTQEVASRSHATDALGHTAASAFTWTHTPTSAPKSVVVAVTQPLGSADEVTAVTYGGVALTRAVSQARTTTEAMRVYLYHLGTGIPTGAQTVSVTSSGTTAKQAHCFTGTTTDGSDTAVDSSNSSDLGIIANPSLTVTHSGSLTGAVGYAVHGYGGAGTPNLTASAARQTGLTLGFGHDPGAATAESYYRASTTGSSSTYGYTTLASDDQVIAAIVVKPLSNVGATVTAAPADGTGGAPAPAISANFTAAGVAADATGDAPRAVVEGYGAFGSRVISGTQMMHGEGINPFTALPAGGMTISCWYRTTSSVSNGTLVCLGSSDSAGNYLTLGYSPGNYVFAECQGLNYFIGYNTAGQDFQANEWHHLAVVTGHDADGSNPLGYITVYVDGVAGTPVGMFSGAGQGPDLLDLTSIGAEWGTHRSDLNTLGSVSYGAHRDGNYNHVAIWASSLTPVQIAGLAGGASEAALSPDRLWLLHGDDDPELEINDNGWLTLLGSPASSDFHAQVAEPAGVGDATVSAPAADAVGDTPSPAVAAGATVTAPPADAVGDTPAPTASAGATVTTPAADGTGDAPITDNIISAVVTTDPADATGTAPIPAVSGSSSTSSTVTAPPASGTGAAPAPGVQAGATITTGPAGATGSTPAPSTQAGATVSSPAADATGSTPAPTVTATGAGTVAATPASATGDAPDPTVAASATVTTPAADATGTAPAATATGGTSATVTSPAAAATGDAPVPAASAGADVTGVPADATGDTPTPGVQGSVTEVQAVAAAATGDAPAPTARTVIVLATIPGGRPRNGGQGRIARPKKGRAELTGVN